MAKIDEERVLLRFSTMIPDTESITTYSLVNSDILANLMIRVNEFYEELLNQDPHTANLYVIIEANIVSNTSNI